MSILYCTVPHFAAALARRDEPTLSDKPLVLIDPERRVFGTSLEAQAHGIVPGITARVAEIRCPEAALIDADIAACRETFDALLDVLELVGPTVEPHSLGAAYVDVGDLAQERNEGIDLCKRMGRAVRRALGTGLQPALGWNSSKFTAQAAARHARPGRLLAVDADDERTFLDPLPVSLLPLPADVRNRLELLGLYTLGQYAALSPAAVLQQFGRPGKQAHRYARGEDDRPVVSRWHAPSLSTMHFFDDPVTRLDYVVRLVKDMVSPLATALGDKLQACGQLRLAVAFDDNTAYERTRHLLFPTAELPLLARASAELLSQIQADADRDGGRDAGCSSAIRTGIMSVTITLAQICDAPIEQLALFPTESDNARALHRVQRYLTARFGAGKLRRASLAYPRAPLPEWRVAWYDDQDGSDEAAQ
jgi:nucleotidyltransferase/DNA polymerase involved in DNA repair